MSKSRRQPRRGEKGDYDPEELPHHLRKRRRNIRKRGDRSIYGIPPNLDEDLCRDLDEQLDDGNGKNRR